MNALSEVRYLLTEVIQPASTMQVFRQSNTLMAFPLLCFFGSFFLFLLDELIAP